MSSSGDPYQPVNPGSSIRPSARAENAKAAAAKKHANTKYGEGGGGESGRPRGPTRVRMTFGSFLEPFSIVGFNPAVIPPADDVYATDADPVFDATFPGFNKAIGATREPAGSGDVVEVVTHGPAICRVNVVDASHGFAAPSSSTTVLTSNASFGFPIIDKQPGTGLLLAVVMLNGDANPKGPPGYSEAAVGFIYGNTGSGWAAPLSPANYAVQLRGAGYHKVTAAVPGFIAGSYYQFSLSWRFATSEDGATWTPDYREWPIVSGYPGYYGSSPGWFYTGSSTGAAMFQVGNQDLYVGVQMGGFSAGSLNFGTHGPLTPLVQQGVIIGEKVGTNYGFG